MSYTVEQYEFAKSYLKEHPQVGIRVDKRITPELLAELLSIGDPIDKAILKTASSARNRLQRKRRKALKKKGIYKDVKWSVSVAEKQLKQQGLELEHPREYKARHAYGDSPTHEQIKMLRYLGINQDKACSLNRKEAASLIAKLKKNKNKKPKKNKSISVWEKARLKKEAEINASK